MFFPIMLLLFMSGIMALCATSSYYDATEIATRILPNIVVLTVDPDRYYSLLINSSIIDLTFDKIVVSLSHMYQGYFPSILYHF